MAPEIGPYAVTLHLSADVHLGGDTIEPNRILIIESDEASAVAAALPLEKAGYSVISGTDALDGLKKLYEANPDLIIMARELPMVDGEDPCLRVRQASHIPIIVIGSKEDAAETLEIGADAYILKPPSPVELVARVRALLRRIRRHDPPADDHKSITDNRLPDGGNGSNGLTRTEFRLASCLILNKGRLLEYPRLISEVWGGKKVGRANLHFYMRRLRRKLTSFSISELRGVGYYVPVDSSETGLGGSGVALARGLLSK